MKFNVGDKVRFTEFANTIWTQFDGIYTVNKVEINSQHIKVIVAEIQNPSTKDGWFLEERFELVSKKEPFQFISVSLSGEENLKRVKNSFPMLKI
jgi:hypothetical protein